MAPTKADFWPPFIDKPAGLFELIWAEVTERRMQSCGVVEPVDVIGNSANGLLMRVVNGVINLFDLEALEKALHRCVVVAIGFSAHALQESVISEAVSECFAGVLGASVAVDDQPFLRLSEGDRLVERGQREFGIDVLAGGPADDFP